MASFRRRLDQDVDAALDPKEHGNTVSEATVLTPNSEPLAAVNTGLHRGLKAH
jgi:hypothetical protein